MLYPILNLIILYISNYALKFNIIQVYAILFRSQIVYHYARKCRLYESLSALIFLLLNILPAIELKKVFSQQFISKGFFLFKTFLVQRNKFLSSEFILFICAMHMAVSPSNRRNLSTRRTKKYLSF